MKTFWSWSAKILFIIVVFSAFYIYQQKASYEQLVLENKQLRLELSAAQKMLSDEQSKVAALEKKTLDGMLEETNKVVVSGWETLLGSVKAELEKARQLMKQSTSSDAESPEERNENDKKQPSESPSSHPNQPIVDGERT